MDVYCEHGLKVYQLSDGTMFKSCSICNEGYIEPVKKSINKNDDLRLDQYCDVDTIYWLSENSIISIECPENVINKFKEEYFLVKKDYPLIGKNFCYLKKEGWNLYMSIIFDGDKADFLNFHPSLNIRKLKSGKNIISCNKLIWQLLGIGFEIGRNHNVNKVLEYLCRI